MAILSSKPGLWREMKNRKLARGWLVGLSAIVLASPLVAQESPLRLVATVPLPRVHGRIDHFAIDPAGKRLFMSALGNGTLEVFDLRDNKLIHTIRGLHEPQGVTFVPQSQHIFIANGGDGAVRIFDGKTYQLLKIVHLSSDADDTRFDASKNEVFVAFGHGGNAGIAILDGASGKILATIKLPAHPEGFQLEKAGPLIYVNLPDANNIVAVVNRRDRKIVATWKLGSTHDNFPMALDEAEHRLFVVCREPAELLVLSTETGEIVATIPCVKHADDLWYDAAKRRIYVSGGEGFITVVQERDANHYRRIAEFATASGGRTSLLAPELGKLYLGIWGVNGGTEELQVYALTP